MLKNNMDKLDRNGSNYCDSDGNWSVAANYSFVHSKRSLKVISSVNECIGILKVISNGGHKQWWN